MKVSDYIVEYLIEKQITDVFGYPGGMVIHLMDSFNTYKNQINAHVVYHEQSAAFAACGYAQASGRPGVAYATSGPGATNLITGICNAYFDSIPTIFITGQVNTFESKKNLKVRQRGFQETDIVSMVQSVTKYSAYVECADKIKYYLDKAFLISMQDRKGSVLLDIPMDIFRMEINPDELEGYEELQEERTDIGFFSCVSEALRKSKRPCFLIGNGIKMAGTKELLREAVSKVGCPVISSMLAVDVITNTEYNYGFVGAYGARCANFILAKSDLVITLGTRLDVRQIGSRREEFAQNAAIIRIDIDSGELGNKIRSDELSFEMDIKEALKILLKVPCREGEYNDWLETCKEMESRLKGIDCLEPNFYIEAISRLIPDNTIITTDVGQNQVWVAQSFNAKENQNILFSGGHGAMGYSLPAAIGAHYGSKKPVICFCGDGGFQMNIQELQFIAREKIPIKIIVMNNSSLGMIRHFQEMYFKEKYTQTIKNGGYSVPDFCSIANAYGLKSKRIKNVEQILSIDFEDQTSELIEIMLSEKTYVFPKLEFGKLNQEQEPRLDEKTYSCLMGL